MPQMPTRIAKTNILRNLEVKWNADPAQAAKALKDLLTNANLGLHSVYEKFMGLSPTHPDVKHLRDDWFDEQNGWWKPYQPIDPIIRQGLIEACDLSLEEKGRPIDCYWICTGAPFEVWVGDGNPQLSVIICTAPPPENLDGLKIDEEVLVMRTGPKQKGERLVRTETPLPNHPVNVLRPLRTPPHS